MNIKIVWDREIMSDSRSITQTNSAIRKIHSEKGASITMALLVFLVCAVFSVAVIVAASAAAGRMAGLAETDQKYYSVTSAAEVIKDKLDGQCVSTFSLGNTAYVFESPINMIDQDSIDNYVVPADGAPVSFNVAMATKDPVSVTITAGGQTVNAEVKKIPNSNTLCLAVHDHEKAAGSKYVLKLYFSETVSNEGPPLLKDEEKPVTDAREVTWHFNRMVSAYDDDRE